MISLFFLIIFGHGEAMRVISFMASDWNCHLCFQSTQACDEMRGIIEQLFKHCLIIFGAISLVSFFLSVLSFFQVLGNRSVYLNLFTIFG